MRVARQASAPATGRLVGELKPKREDERQDELDKRFAIAEYLEVGRFIAEINGDGTVVAGRLGALSHVSPSVEMAVGVDETSWRQCTETSSGLRDSRCVGTVSGGMSPPLFPRRRQRKRSRVVARGQRL